MPLTQSDLSAIKGIVDTSVNSAVQNAIDELSLQVGAGFNEVTERFERVDQRLDHLGRDASTLKTDVREIKWNLADTVRRAEFIDLRERVDRIEHKSER